MKLDLSYFPYRCRPPQNQTTPSASRKHHDFTGPPSATTPQIAALPRQLMHPWPSRPDKSPPVTYIPPPYLFPRPHPIHSTSMPASFNSSIARAQVRPLKHRHVPTSAPRRARQTVPSIPPLAALGPPLHAPPQASAVQYGYPNCVDPPLHPAKHNPLFAFAGPGIRRRKKYLHASPPLRAAANATTP